MSDCKKCKRCGEVKPLDEYWRHRQQKDGRTTTCKACHKKLPSVVALTKAACIQRELGRMNDLINRFLRGEFTR